MAEVDGVLPGLLICERNPKGHGGSFANSVAGGADIAAMLVGDGADEEETEAGALDLDEVVRGDAVKAAEDTLELARRDAEACVADGKHSPGVVLDAEAAADVDATGGVFHGIVEQVEDGGAEVFGVAEDEEPDCAGNFGEEDGVGSEVVADADDADAVGDEWV